MSYLDDADWEDSVITGVTERDGWYNLSFREYGDTGGGGMGISLEVAKFVEADVPAPKEGDALRLCGSIGRPVRGAIVNSRLVFYRTPEEETARHTAWVQDERAKRRREFEATGRAELDAKYNALPPVFQARIDKFRHNNPDFRWEYEEYEMFCCEEAVKLAEYLASPDAMAHYVSLARHDTYSADEARWTREWEEQKAIDRAAGISHDHSGNTHGAMVALANLYVNAPEGVRRMHGALAPLVGSFAYGCVPPDGAV